MTNQIPVEVIAASAIAYVLAIRAGTRLGASGGFWTLASAFLALVYAVVTVVTGLLMTVGSYGIVAGSWPAGWPAFMVSQVPITLGILGVWLGARVSAQDKDAARLPIARAVTLPLLCTANRPARRWRWRSR